jgi:hypothetical protein
MSDDSKVANNLANLLQGAVHDILELESERDRLLDVCAHLSSLVAQQKANIDRLTRIEVKATGLLATSYVPESGEVKVVRQWWDGLSAAIAGVDDPEPDAEFRPPKDERHHWEAKDD